MALSVRPLFGFKAARGGSIKARGFPEMYCAAPIPNSVLESDVPHAGTVGINGPAIWGP